MIPDWINKHLKVENKQENIDQESKDNKILGVIFASSQDSIISRLDLPFYLTQPKVKQTEYMRQFSNHWISGRGQWSLSKSKQSRWVLSLPWLTILREFPNPGAEKGNWGIAQWTPWVEDRAENPVRPRELTFIWRSTRIPENRKLPRKRFAKGSP